MPEFNVNVRWNGKMLRSIVLSTEESLNDFKAKVYSLTDVVPGRQKLIHSGRIIDEELLRSIEFKDGLTFMMIGSVDVKEPPHRLQNNTSNEVTSKRTTAPLPGIGLLNLGNTCYFNAVIQLLRSARGFMNEIVDGSFSAKQNSILVDGIASLLKQTESGSQQGGGSVTFIFPSFISSFPQFGNNAPGIYKQQDANECMQCVLSLFSSTDVVMKYFGIKMTSTLKQVDGVDERTSTEMVLNLSCYITKDVKDMMDGIRSKLDEIVDMKSDSASENVRFGRKVQISRLPQYLMVVFVRFFYKEDVGVSAKILKEIKFPHKLDMSSLCDDELREKIKLNRELIIRYDDQKKKVLSDDNTPMTNPNFGDDPGSNNSGMYELAGVLTHKGRSCSSGHYVAWLNRAEPGRACFWYQYDDETVTPVAEKHIDNLAGGGDWHSAYILMYRSRSIPSRTEDW
ncbi:hypothetical protein ACOME3_002605 [Neoechinorhynchus agilis]